VFIDDKSCQPWYKCYISYLIGPTSGSARHGYCAYILPDWSDWRRHTRVDYQTMAVA